MFLQVLSPSGIDSQHLNTFSERFLVGQSLVFLTCFIVFPPLLRMSGNCPFFQKRKNRFTPILLRFFPIDELQKIPPKSAGFVTF